MGDAQHLHPKSLLLIHPNATYSLPTLAGGEATHMLPLAGLNFLITL
jgi:hypothetical protein